MVHYGGSTQWKLFRNDRTLGGSFFLFCFITTRSRIHEELRKIFVKAVLTPLSKTGAFSTVIYPGSRGPFSKYLKYSCFLSALHSSLKRLRRERSPGTISIDKKKMCGTQGNRGFDMRGMVTKFVLVWLFSTSSGVFAIFYRQFLTHN